MHFELSRIATCVTPPVMHPIPCSRPVPSPGKGGGPSYYNCMHPKFAQKIIITFVFRSDLSELIAISFVQNTFFYYLLYTDYEIFGKQARLPFVVGLPIPLHNSTKKNMQTTAFNQVRKVALITAYIYSNYE